MKAKLIELRIPVDKRKKALEYFAYAYDWIKRHQNCTTCTKAEWRGCATYLSKMIQVYLKGDDIFDKGIPENQKETVTG